MQKKKYKRLTDDEREEISRQLAKRKSKPDPRVNRRHGELVETNSDFLTAITHCGILKNYENVFSYYVFNRIQ